MEEKPEKLSWNETASALAVEDEKWDDWEPALADGLDSLTWKS